MSTSSENTQLTPADGYIPTKSMIFADPVSGTIPDSKPKIEYKRINISTRNPDGTEGELVFPTERLFSFGVSENTSQETGKVTGYTFPICMWSRDEPTKKEKIWTATFNKIIDCCIDHLLANREEIEMYELSRGDLTKSKGGLNPMYYKKEKHVNEAGKTVLRVVPGSVPTLYTKLFFSKKSGKFMSQFFDLDDNPINALDLMGKFCHTNAAIKIESIFIGAKISMQCKLYEAVVEPSSSGIKRLLVRPKANSKVLAAKSELKTAASVMDDDDDDAGSLVSSECEDEPVVISAPKKITPKKITPKKAVKRVVKRVRKTEAEA